MRTYSVFFSSLGRDQDRFTGKLIQSSIEEFWGMTQAVLLECLSKIKHSTENDISRILGRNMDEFSRILQ